MSNIPGIGDRPPGRAVNAILWYLAVKQATGATHASQLEERFAKTSEKRRSSQYGGSWARYSRGATSPSVPLLNRVGDEFPDTARWIDHPTGKMLDSKVHSLSALRVCATDLPARYATMLVSAEATKTFWAQLPSVQGLSNLGDEEDFDAVATLLVAISLAELAQNEGMHIWASHELLRCLASMGKDDGIANLPRDLAVFIIGVTMLKRLTATHYRDPSCKLLLTQLLSDNFTIFERKWNKTVVEPGRGNIR